MTIQSQILTTKVAGRPILHSLIVREQTPKGLVMMLPGRGYLNVHPLMHYLQKIALTQGFDVLSVTYGFQTQLYSMGNIEGDLIEEIRQVADQVWSQRSYDRIVLAGKSLGTPLASAYGSELSMRFPDAEIAYIMLTPVQGATSMIEQRPTLAVISTADAAYDPAVVEADTQNSWIEWLILDHLNHALEVADDWQQSILALQTILTGCEGFLKRL
jgi:predicted alpha/beta-fold hydrolase